jgi:hypothetical protein
MFPAGLRGVDIRIHSSNMRQMHKYISIILLTIFSTGFWGCGGDKTNSNPTDRTETKPQPDYPGFLKPRKGDAATIIHKLNLQETKDFEDFMDLGTAYIYDKERKGAEGFKLGADAYEKAQILTSNDRQRKMAALYARVGATAYFDIKEALKLVDELVAFDLRNLENAQLRRALYRKAGNDLGLLAAEDHLALLDDTQIGNTVLDPVTGAVLVAVVVSATTVAIYALTPPKDRKDIAEGLMNGYYQSVKKPTSPIGISLSHYFEKL